MFCFQWEAQHQDLSCEQFQQWKRENDPEYQRQGLAGYLRDNGISEAADFNHTLSFHFFITKTSLYVYNSLLSGRLTHHRVYLCPFVATAAKKFNLKPSKYFFGYVFKFGAEASPPNVLYE